MQIRSDKSKSEILSHTKALLLISNEEKDPLLEALIDDAYSYAVSYTGVEEIPSSLICRMTCEDYSKTSGVAKKSRASMSEEYIDGYSSSVRSLLNGMRKIKTL